MFNARHLRDPMERGGLFSQTKERANSNRSTEQISARNLIRPSSFLNLPFAKPTERIYEDIDGANGGLWPIALILSIALGDRYGAVIRHARRGAASGGKLNVRILRKKRQS